MGRRRRGRAVHGILLVDKPAGGSSNAVLQRVRRSLNAAKAGHAGTLDPLATGMLPVLLGEATKFASYLISSRKAYEATLRLGIETDSLDADGEVVSERPVPALTREDLETAVAALRGTQQQVPPMVSAIKANGERLYKLAREGREVERQARQIEVEEFEILEIKLPELRVRVRCSKGTYIRVLGADLGNALGCGAHVTALRRIWVAPFEGQAMVSPADIEIGGEALLLPMDAGLAHLSRVQLDAAGVQAFRHGHAVPAALMASKPDQIAVGSGRPVTEGAGLGADEPLRVCDPQGGIIGLGAVQRAAPLHIRPIKVLQLESETA